MELPQARTFGDEDRKRTHDFLSLYSTGQQDPRPSQVNSRPRVRQWASGQARGPFGSVFKGSYLKTHDFLQPLEISTVEKPPPPGPPPRPSATHILPGGFGTYSISYHEKRAPEKEGAFSMAAQASSTERNDENSNCSSYSGSGFTLWEESDSKKGKTGKENIVGERLNVKVNSTALSSLSSSQQPIFEKYPSFTKMLTSSKMAEEEDDEEFVVKKEASAHSKGNFAVKVEGRSPDQKPSTPRSKHSATEQRRRCKINDRFQRLREIIPHGDQKRDKASFLLEVIEYVQYLQEKVNRYEGSYQGCNQEPSKLRPWGKRYGYGEGLIEQSHCTSSGSGQAMIFTAKIDDINTNDIQKLEHHLNVVVLPKERLQKPEFPFNRTFDATEAYSSGVGLDMNKPATQQVQAHFQPRVSTNDAEISDPKLNQQEQQSIENGSINISSVYSQQLLNSLTRALRHSGVDLSQANVDVKIDLGKSAKREVYPSISTYKNDIPMNVSSRAGSRSQTVGTGEEYDEALKKRLKTSRS